jgi:hypothetical protein
MRTRSSGDASGCRIAIPAIASLRAVRLASYTRAHFRAGDIARSTRYWTRRASSDVSETEGDRPFPSTAEG